MYYRRPLALFTIFSYLASAAIIPRSNPEKQSLPFSSHVVHQFPYPTWVENIAVRKNGKLLVTLVTPPDVYLIDPLTSSSAPTSNTTATLIHSFAPDAAAVLGITEVAPDHFYVITSNYSILLSPQNPALNTSAVWSIDLSRYNPTLNTGAQVQEVTALRKAGFLNGMSTLDASRNLVVLADSAIGAVWVLDVQTGDYRILLQEPEMAPPSSPTGAFILGINGLKVLPPAPRSDTAYIYFGNTGLNSFYRVPVCLSTLQKSGAVEFLANVTGNDDFALDEREGVAYVATEALDAVVRIPLSGGTAEIVVGGINETVVKGPTSVFVGRGHAEEGLIFVATNGGLGGAGAEGGKVVAVDTKCWS